MIAKTILQQLKAGTDTRGLNGGIKCMACWGTHALTNTGRGLAFKVNGAKFRGWVEITLNDLDLYDIELYTLRRPRRKKTGDFLKDLNRYKPRLQIKKVKQTFEGIYFDQLIKIIDSAVERTT